MQLVPINVASAFNMPMIASDVVAPGLASPMRETPIKKETYFHRRELVRDIRAFFLSNEISLMLYGYTGSGKSTCIEQYHAATNLPLLTITGNPDSMKSDFIGKVVMTSNGLAWRDGPLLKAARNGWSILIDEWNLTDPGVAASLNSWFEGRGEYIDDLDEMIRPAPGFRIFTASNPADVGKGNLGRNVQDLSSDDRGMFIWVDYPTPEEETPLIYSALEGIEDDGVRDLLATNIVKVANEIRTCYKSDKSEQKLSVPMSTRVAERWAKLIVVYGSGGNSSSRIHYALERVLTLRATIDQHERETIHEFVHQNFGVVYQPSHTFNN